jgi:hypothetical protein
MKAPVMPFLPGTKADVDSPALTGASEPFDEMLMIAGWPGGVPVNVIRDPKRRVRGGGDADATSFRGDGGGVHPCADYSDALVRPAQRVVPRALASRYRDGVAVHSLVDRVLDDRELTGR